MIYSWNKTKSHDKCVLNPQAPLKSLWSAASISNALKITHGGTSIALDVGRNSRSFNAEVGCPVGETSRKQILTHVFCCTVVPFLLGSTHEIVYSVKVLIFHRSAESLSEIARLKKDHHVPSLPLWRMVPTRIETKSQNLYVKLPFWFTDSCIFETRTDLPKLPWIQTCHQENPSRRGTLHLAPRLHRQVVTTCNSSTSERSLPY